MRTGNGRGTVTATTAVTVLALAMPATLQGQQEELRPIDETRPVARDVRVEVETLIRTVRVTGWDRDEVRVQGAIHPDYEELVFDGDRGSVDIEIERRDDRGRWWEGRVPDLGPLTISVPRGADVEVDMVNGSLSVEAVDGTVEAESVNGDIRYAGGSDRVEAETVNGRVVVEAPRGRRIRAGSVNGGVMLRVGGGFVEAEAVSGDVDIRADGPVEALTAETVAGDIEFRGRPVSGASLAFETHSGDIVLRLPGDLQARLEATTFSGRIESAFGGQPENASRWTPEQSYRRMIGSDDVRITAETFSGVVRFLKEGG